MPLLCSRGLCFPPHTHTHACTRWLPPVPPTQARLAPSSRSAFLLWFCQEGFSPEIPTHSPSRHSCFLAHGTRTTWTAQSKQLPPHRHPPADRSQPVTTRRDPIDWAVLLPVI